MWLLWLLWWWSSWLGDMFAKIDDKFKDVRNVILLPFIFVLLFDLVDVSRGTLLFKVDFYVI